MQGGRYSRSIAFFSWSRGSKLFFWRWSPETRTFAQTGHPTYQCGPLPVIKRQAQKPKPLVYPLLLAKLSNFITRGYFSFPPPEEVQSYIDVFEVAKGSDIRPVFNGKSSGINDAVWAPNFQLPTATSMVNILDYDFEVVDCDLGEMFLNFPLDPNMQLFSGVDLTPYKLDLEKMHPELKTEDHKLIAVWNRSWMGYKPSPYGAIRIYYHAEEFIVGDIREPNNPFRFDTVILNMHGNDDFNPALRRVYKYDTLNKRSASDMKIYVDDLRTAGATRELAWQAARRATSRLQFLGIQDAPRKRRLDNGPWAGGIFSTSDEKITKSVTESKWTKGRDIVWALVVELKENPNKLLEFKRLERDRGFLCHMAMTFDQIFPYLKGFHLSLCSHLRQRNEEGWKTQELE